MKGFRFRLERVLRLRSRAEREQAQVYGEAMRAEEARRLALAQAAERLERCGEQVSTALDGQCTAGALTNFQLVMDAASQGLDSAERSHRDALEQMQVEHERLGQARRERRVVERLREKRQEAWTQETSREEQRELDGVARHRWLGGGRPA